MYTLKRKRKLKIKLHVATLEVKKEKVINETAFHVERVMGITN